MNASMTKDNAAPGLHFKFDDWPSAMNRLLARAPVSNDRARSQLDATYEKALADGERNWRNSLITLGCVCAALALGGWLGAHFINPVLGYVAILTGLIVILSVARGGIAPDPETEAERARKLLWNQQLREVTEDEVTEIAQLCELSPDVARIVRHWKASGNPVRVEDFHMLRALEPFVRTMAADKKLEDAINRHAMGEV